MNECLTLKNNRGERVYDPEVIKETMANYYENMYAKKTVKSHAHQLVVEAAMENYAIERNYDHEWFNEPPSEHEIREIREWKRNGKASTDIRTG